MKSRVLSVALGLVAVVFATASAQWLEATLFIPDSFGGLRMPNCLAYDSADNTVFVGGETTRMILVLDAHDGHRLARIPLKANISALCYNSVSNKVYAAAADLDSVAVIDAGTRQVVAMIPAGGGPIALEYNLTMNRVYCAVPNGNVVIVIDGEGDNVLATVPVQQQPNAVCWNPVRNVVYCANTGSNTVSVIDAATDTVVATIPTGSAPIGLVYNPDLNKLYAANYGSGTVTVIDGFADSVLANVDGGESPFRLCYNPLNNKVYAADEEYYMMVIDCGSDTRQGYTDVYCASDVVYNPADNRVYAADRYRLEVIDGATDSLLAQVEIGEQEAEVCIADSGRRAFGTADEDCLVGVIDCVTDSLLAAIVTDLHVRLPAVCYNPTTDRAYCAVQGANLVMVVDGTNNTIRQLIPVGLNPSALLHNPFGNKVYCANVSEHGVPASITAIDGEGDSALWTIETGPQAGQSQQVFCLNTAGDRLYLALSNGYADGAVLVVDAVADTTICEVSLGYSAYGPYALCYGPAYNYVYASVASEVDVIDGEANVMIARVNVGSEPAALCYVPLEAKVYTANEYDGTVSVIAGERPEVIALIDVGDGPTALCWNSSDNRVFCANAADSTVAVIDASADTVITRLHVGESPCALVYDSLNDYVYCACRGSNEVYVIDGRRDSVVATIGVGTEPVALAWNPVRLRTYVANRSGSSVSVIRDSLHPGVQEFQPQASSPKPQATVVRGVLFLPRDMTELPGNSDRVPRSVLLDISGRRVMSLRPGANDIRYLASGVYFVITPSPSSSPPEGERVGVRRRPASVTKVVVTK